MMLQQQDEKLFFVPFGYGTLEWTWTPATSPGLIISGTPGFGSWTWTAKPYDRTQARDHHDSTKPFYSSPDDVMAGYSLMGASRAELQAIEEEQRETPEQEEARKKKEADDEIKKTSKKRQRLEFIDAMELAKTKMKNIILRDKKHG